MYSEKTPGDGQRNCPKHVEFYSKNKFEKLVHLVGFIIAIILIVEMQAFNEHGEALFLQIYPVFRSTGIGRLDSNNIDYVGLIRKFAGFIKNACA